MPLVGDALGLAMMAAVDALSDSQKADRAAVFKAMGGAIVTYLQANALVIVTVASVAGVTPGPGVSGPGAGTGTLT